MNRSALNRRAATALRDDLGGPPWGPALFSGLGNAARGRARMRYPARIRRLAGHRATRPRRRTASRTNPDTRDRPTFRHRTEPRTRAGSRCPTCSLCSLGKRGSGGHRRARLRGSLGPWTVKPAGEIWSAARVLRGAPNTPLDRRSRRVERPRDVFGTSRNDRSFFPNGRGRSNCASGRSRHRGPAPDG